MPFCSLSTVNFRNLANATIDLFAREVFFTGENGQGKSNLLEALYFSSNGASFRTHLDGEMIRNGEGGMSVRTLYKGADDEGHTSFISLEGSRKKMERDGKIVRDRKDLVSAMPCVLYSHDDLDFAKGSPERKRFFVDQTLSMYDVLYIDLMRRYKRILKSRNLCLNEHNLALLDRYYLQLAQNGLEIQKRRKMAIFKFKDIFSRLYEEVSGLSGVTLRYLPSWKKPAADSAAEGMPAAADLPSVDDVLARLRDMRLADEKMGTTMTGPHRDRIEFEKDGLPFIPLASMGQRRLVALVLRTAQAVYFTEETRRKPVLLMDDVLLELDPGKRERMTALLPDYEQLFCTFLPGEPWRNYIRSETKVYEIQAGSWKSVP
ncbi:MAG: DNA replication/repair protein RecF [Treponema sp.]|nr:DNA replication/repair protein RecF [Treponema sp.]